MSPRASDQTSKQAEFSQRDLELIAARAATISERVETIRRAGSAGATAPCANLHPWVRAFSPGDPAAFLRRLSWDGWTESEVERAIADDPVCVPTVAREWTDTLCGATPWFVKAAEELDAMGRIAEESYFEPASPPPFLELCCPFLRAGRELLQEERAGSRSLAPSAWIALERRLLTDLSFQCAPALQKEFSIFRAGAGYPGKAGPPAPPDPLHDSGADSRRLYGAFVERMLRGELVEFFTEYSRLARQLSRLVDTWVGSTREFLARLDSDWSELEREFGSGASFASVAEMEPGLSDRHREGRQVLVARFATGTRVVYKPRSVALEAVYNRFLGWLADRGLAPAPRSLRVMERDGYGWVEFVETTPAFTGAEIAGYYRRAGALLCVSYVLRGDDLCAENLIATDEGPVIVDAENFAQPRFATAAPGDLGDRNVLRSQLLSSIQIDPTGAPYDAGGLDGRGGQVAEIRRPVWRFTNTDAMFCEHRVALTGPTANAVRLDGISQAPGQYAEEMTRGFEDTYRILLRHRAELLEDNGPLAELARCPTRILLRPSNAYAVLLHRLTRPRYQRRAVLGSILTDALNRVFSTATVRPRDWPLIRQERVELEGLDIPYFTLPTDQRSVEGADGENARDFVSLPGLDAVRSQIDTLSAEDLKEQCRLIREVSAELRGPLSKGAWATERKLGPDETLRKTFLEQAVEIGETLRRRAAATRARDQSERAWLQPDFARGLPLSPNLYDGAAGIGIFLAALAHATGEDSYAELARSAGDAVSGILENNGNTRVPGRPTLGACTGLGGIIYSQALMTRLLRRPDDLDRARRTAGQLATEPVPDGESTDFADGLAGAILALLGLCDHHPEPELLNLSLGLCDRLLALERREVGEAEEKSSVRGNVCGGFAHGAAGIACALARAYRAGGQARFLAEARTQFAAACRLVASRPSAPPAGLAQAWCHGSPGLGLAYLDAWEVLEDPLAPGQIDRLLQATVASGLSDTDHLCCGNLGRVDFLVEASLVLEKSKLLRVAGELAKRVVRRAETDGFRLDDGVASYDPGFFRGLSGIGYEFLRLARPGAYPSILAFRRIP